MLTHEKGASGLGWAVEGSGKRLRFKHGGRDEGFDTFLMACAETGQGAAVLINANDNSGAIQRILDVIEHEYQWPNR